MSGAQAYPGNSGYSGAAGIDTPGSLFKTVDFLARQVIAGKAFAGLVKVLSVKGGGVAGPCIVSVRPLVNQVDGDGKQTPHGEIFNIPVFRYQAGHSAFIVDPVVGDTGDAVICHRDSSTAKSTRTFAGPGSNRENDWSDGCYFGEFLGGPVTNYVWVKQDGIVIVSTGTVAVTSPRLEHNGINVGFDHVHTEVQTGSDLSGPPEP